MLKWPHYLKILIFFTFLIVLYGAWQILPVQKWSLLFSQFAQDQGAPGILLYGFLYVLATVLLFPGAFLTFAAGIAYGAWGVPLILIATCIGSSISFLIARNFARDEVSRYMNKRPVTQALKTAIEIEGWKFLLLFRVSPLIPFNLNSYFLGTVKIGFGTYLWITFLGALPGTILFTYLGSIGQNLNEQHILTWFFISLSVLVTYLLARMTLKKTKEILHQNRETTQFP